MFTKNAGVIELGDGFQFIWTRGNGDGEIFGSIQKPDGSILHGITSGWYRTNDPEEAARYSLSLKTPV